MHLVELFLNPSALAVFARERGLGARELAADPSYAVHTWLVEALGAQAVRPFRLMQLNPRLRVLGYSDESAEQLAERMVFNATPSVAQVLEGNLQSKPLPATFTVGDSFAFEIKLQATRKTVGNVEKDAFLVECDRRGAGVAVDRLAVYQALLSERLAPAAVMTSAQVTSFEIAAIVRKQQRGDSRVASMLRVPQVHLKGTLQVAQADAFVQMLRSGVGRGSGLGFGMLMLRRP